MRSTYADRKPLMEPSHGAMTDQVSQRECSRLRATSLRLTSSGGRLRRLRAWSMTAAVNSFAGSKSLSVNPSSQASCPHVRQCSWARLTFHSLMSTRSEPHWQKRRTGTAQCSDVANKRQNLSGLAGFGARLGNAARPNGQGAGCGSGNCIENARGRSRVATIRRDNSI